MNVAGAPAISRPVEVSRVQIGPGMWDVTYAGGGVLCHVDGTASMWTLTGDVKKDGQAERKAAAGA